MATQENRRIITLYQKFSAKTASEIELEEFNAFLETANAEERLFELLETDYLLSDVHNRKISKVRALQIFQEIVRQPQVRPKARRLWLRLAGVAAVTGIVAISLFLNPELLDRNGLQSASITAKQDIAPGTNNATLTLSDGRKIVLSAAPEGELAKESDVRISKSSDGRISYEYGSHELPTDAGMNILSTSRGETYRVKLPDGSIVWLNSGSSLKYPASFAALKDRSVDLEGEAYFEIEKDASRPFIVKSGGQELTVLGTRFNIKAYKDERDIITTLQDGKVKVAYQAATWGDKGKVTYKDDIVLNPGQQSLLKGESIRITTANLEESLAWKEGDFIFNNADIESVMRDVARWYDIQVVYQGEIPKGSFSGNVSRNKNISQILRALESTKLVRFKIEGRRVYVVK
ncbi:MAG TPA: FecR domain-containing protein [Pseudosphingobacterium sp.]|nr:FecR domain-containing protein [Pseudosphingobacterium sp.]